MRLRAASLGTSSTAAAEPAIEATVTSVNASFATSSNSVPPAPARRPAGRSTLHAAVSLHLHGCNGRSDDEYQHRLCHEGWQ